ncbi:MAG: peroxide stress protein YaaA [Planctomycetota bacterium]
MLILLSPAKTLDLTPPVRELPATKPVLHADACRLAAIAKELSRDDFAELMSVSDALAETAHGYFQDWRQKWDDKRAKQAVLAFRGDVYQGLDADTLCEADLLYAQDHLRVLSGLYGVLRPLDLMQGYRLEMGRPLANPRGRDLYAFWREKVTAEVDLAANACDEPLVVNLASKEYAGVVDFGRLEAAVVSPAFLDLHNGQYKTLGLFAKRARGMMARFLIQTRAETEADLHGFNAAGYRHNRERSEPGRPAFTRDRAV